LTSVTSTTFVGALTGAATTAGTVTTAAQPNITSVGTLTSISSSGNVTGGNLITAGVASATGNITTSNFFVGNGAFLTGISAAVSVSKIENGNSNVQIQPANSNVTVTVAGLANIATFTTGSLTLVGGFANPKTISLNISLPASVNAMLVGPITIANGASLTVPDSSSSYIYM
jgi:hypothetical protein